MHSLVLVGHGSHTSGDCAGVVDQQGLLPETEWRRAALVVLGPVQVPFFAPTPGEPDAASPLPLPTGSAWLTLRPWEHIPAWPT